MSKRKWGFKQILNGLSAKSTQGSSFADAEDWPSDSADDDHFDPSTVNRPKIDVKTAAQLRDACEFIVRNLKPSGYDIEDTRMKSDVLVDDLSDQDEPPLAALPPVKRRSQGKPPASTWYQEDSDRNSRIAAFSDAREPTDKRKSAAASIASSLNAKRRSDHSRVLQIMEQEQEFAGGQEPLQVESPSAPVPSARRQSRQEVSSPITTRISNHKGTSTDRNGSSSTMSTQYTTSTNGYPSTSTGVTSTNQTPASTSKRTSDPPKFEVGSTGNAVAVGTAGSWMKEEVDRRKQAEVMRSDPSTAYQSGSTDKDFQAVDRYLQAQAVPLVYSRASSMNSKSQMEADTATSLSSPPTDESNSRVFIWGDEAEVQPEQQAVEHPERTRGDQSKQQPGETAAFVTESASPRRMPGQGSERELQLHPTRHSNAVGAVQYSDTEAGTSRSGSPCGPSPLLTDFDATLANIRARMAATSLSARPVNANLPEQQPPSSPTTQSEGFIRSFSSVRGSYTSIPQRYASRHAVPQIPPIPNKHQLDDSITVKDFWRPPSASSERNRRDERKSRLNDIEAVGFDTFMSVVEKTNDGSKRTVPPIIVRDPAFPDGVPSSTRSSQPQSPRPHSRVTPPLLAGFPKVTSPGIPHLQTQDRPVTPPVRNASPRHSNPHSPPMPPLPPTLSQRYTSHSGVASPRSEYSPLPPVLQSSPRQPLQQPFHRATLPSQVQSQSIGPQSPTITANGTDGTPTPTSLRSKSAKSLSRVSTSSRGPIQYTPSSADPKSMPKSPSALRRLMGKRKSRSSTMSSMQFNTNGVNGMGVAANGYDHVNGNDRLFGYQTLTDPEYDDPLVCAAPVVAFGRGW